MTTTIKHTSVVLNSILFGDTVPTIDEILDWRLAISNLRESTTQFPDEWFAAEIMACDTILDTLVKIENYFVNEK